MEVAGKEGGRWRTMASRCMVFQLAPWPAQLGSGRLACLTGNADVRRLLLHACARPCPERPSSSNRSDHCTKRNERDLDSVRVAVTFASSRVVGHLCGIRTRILQLILNPNLGSSPRQTPAPLSISLILRRVAWTQSQNDRLHGPAKMSRLHVVNVSAIDWLSGVSLSWTARKMARRNDGIDVRNRASSYPT